MKQFFKELFEYNHHFNQRLFDVFNLHEKKTSEKSLNLYNHILNAHQIWNSRIETQQTTIGVWEISPTQELKNIDEKNFEQTLQILSKVDLNERVHYKNSKGQAFSKRVQDILFHVVNHSTYHRGQIASEFKGCGIEPLATDYIFFRQ